MEREWRVVVGRFCVLLARGRRGSLVPCCFQIFLLRFFRARERKEGRKEAGKARFAWVPFLLPARTDASVPRAAPHPYAAPVFIFFSPRRRRNRSWQPRGWCSAGTTEEVESVDLVTGQRADPFVKIVPCP